MKQLISDWLLTSKLKPSLETLEPTLNSSETHSAVRIVSENGKLLLLIYLYLELRLNVEQAIRAAEADIRMAPTGQSHRLWVEQPQ
jgi:hypothetical protein